MNDGEPDGSIAIEVDRFLKVKFFVNFPLLAWMYFLLFVFCLCGCFYVADLPHLLISLR